MPRPRKKWADDPLVPVDGERLRLALANAGIPLNALARELGRSQHQVWAIQRALDRIVKGRHRRSRRSLVRQAARALDVPAAWLTGATDELPVALRVGIMLETLRTQLRVARTLGQLNDQQYLEVGRLIGQALLSVLGSAQG